MRYCSEGPCGVGRGAEIFRAETPDFRRYFFEAFW